MCIRDRSFEDALGHIQENSSKHSECIVTENGEMCIRDSDMIIDRASATGIIFANPRIDISDEILRKLGYSN